MLYDMRQTSFTLVTIPEMMSVRETERYLTLLVNEGVPVTDLIVNRVEHQHADCRYCKARVASQQPWLKEIALLFPRLRSHFVPLLPDEVRGLEALRIFAGLTWDQAEVKVPTKTRANATQRTLPAKELKKTKKTEAFLFAAHSIFIFGGKGGVGKTTAAAAFSLALARKQRRRQFLVFSTDPAHSLSDSFDEPVAELRDELPALRISTQWKSILAKSLKN